jgi:hypothetical protein
MPSIWNALAICVMFALASIMFTLWAPDNEADSSGLANTVPGFIFVAFSIAAICIWHERRELWWVVLTLVALGPDLAHIAWYKLAWRPSRMK